MPHARDSRQAADRLDALWDDVGRAGAGHIPATADGDVADASFVAYLDLLVPPADLAARERIRRAVFGARKEHPLTQPAALFNVHSDRAESATRPGHRASRRWWRVPLAAVEAATAVALIIAVAGAILLLRPGDDGSFLPAASNLGTPPGTPAAGEERTSLLTLELDSTAADTALTVTLRRLTIPPDARWDFVDDAFPAVPVPINQYVESGTLTVGFRGQEQAVAAGSNFKVAGGPEYIRNGETEPVVMLQAVVHPSDQPPPTPPTGVTIEQIGTVPLSASPADSRTLIALHRGTFQGAGEPAIPSYRKQITVFAAVESGSLLTQTARDATVSYGSIGEPRERVPYTPPTFVPAPDDSTVLRSGQTITTGPSFLITGSAIQGDAPVTTLFLNVQVQMNAERLANDPMTGSSIEWETSASGRTGFMLQQLTLAPGSTLSHDVDGVLHYRVVQGTVRVAFEGQEAQDLGPDGRTAYAGTGHIELASTGSDEAVVIVGLVYAEGHDDGITREQREGAITDTPLGSGIAVLPVGSAIVSLAPVVVPSDPGDATSQYLVNGASLVAVTSGSAQVTRLAGQVEIASGEGADPLRLGEANPIGTHDAVFAQPNSSYRLERADPPASLIVALSVTPVDPAAAPSASPSAARPGDTIAVTPDDGCEVQPRTIAELRALVAAPLAAGTPDRGLRDEADAGQPADQATIDAVTQTVRNLAACTMTGSELQQYALFSDNAVRAAAAAAAITVEDVDRMGEEDEEPTGLDRRLIAVEEVVIYPDGRAGAIVNFDGEIAYLTFVHDGDRWLIDAWDDRELEPPAP